MGVGGSGPHDVRAGIPMRNWQACGFGVEWPDDHPVRAHSNRGTRLVIRIGIASLRGTGEHVGNSRGCVCRLWFVSPLGGGNTNE